MAGNIGKTISSNVIFRRFFNINRLVASNNCLRCPFHYSIPHVDEKGKIKNIGTIIVLIAQPALLE